MCAEVRSDTHTGVDELLLSDFPSFVGLNLGLELTNLAKSALEHAAMGRVGAQHTVSDGSASITNLFCLRSCVCG
jgi:hypothetical protein